MESQYYIFIDGEQKGPLRLDELKEAGVRPTTYVWTKGMEDWQRADEVPDICRMFRQHLAEKMHPQSQSTPDVSLPIPDGRSDGSSPAIPDEDDLKDIPQSYRGFVRKSGTTPGPSNPLEPDTSQPPQVSMALAVLSLILCFPLFGIVSVYFTYKAQKSWKESLNAEPDKAEILRQNSHESARKAKMWMGLAVSFGILTWGFGISMFM